MTQPMQPPPPPPVPGRPVGSSERWTYGLIAVTVGVAAIVAVFGLALLKFDDAQDVVSVSASVIAAIGTLIGAYFGIQVGAAGKEAAERAKDDAHETALMLAGLGDPAAVRAALAERDANRRMR